MSFLNSLTTVICSIFSFIFFSTSFFFSNVTIIINLINADTAIVQTIALIIFPNSSLIEYTNLSLSLCLYLSNKYSFVKNTALNPHKVRKLNAKNAILIDNGVITDGVTVVISGCNSNRFFINIFNVLDSDNDGVINAINACKWKIPDNVVNVLKDVFDEMKETRMEYDKDEFVEMCLDIYDELNNDERTMGTH